MIAFVPKPFPPDAARLCTELHSPALLVRHLVLVHGVAVELLDALAAFHDLQVDRDAILFGAAVHDVGKVLYPHELTGLGDRHEKDGPALLIQLGVSPRLARFARTHGRWQESDDAEDLLVALSDSLWSGRRAAILETKVVRVLAESLGLEPWVVWDRLDLICEGIASRGEERLAWQLNEHQ